MRIGILGGTFDPVHYGHLRPAAEVLQQLQLDQLWLMPNRIPPHKAAASATTEQRLTMLRLAQQEFPQLSICKFELERDVPSYSVLTLQDLIALQPQNSFYFIMGTDSLVTLSSWHQWQQLFSLCHLVICGRDGWQLTAENPVWSEWQQRHKTAEQHLRNTAVTVGDIIQLDIELQPYASTQLRNALEQGDIDTCRQAVPQAVLDFILQQQLYQS